MMPALDFFQRVAHGPLKVIVGRQDVSLQIEFDHGIGRVDRAERSPCNLAFVFSGGDVVAHAQISFGLATGPRHGCDHGVDVVRRTVFRPVLHDAAGNLSPPDGGPHLAERLLVHVRMVGHAVGMAQQLAFAVFRNLREFIVDRDDDARRVFLGDEAGEIHDGPADPELGLEFLDPSLQPGPAQKTQKPIADRSYIGIHHRSPVV